MRIFVSTVLLLCVIIFLVFSFQSCRQSNGDYQGADSLTVEQSIPDAPVLSGEEGIRKMHLESGFDIELVAEEPLVIAPVAMSFDEKGRMWVVEMEDYMPDTLGTGEDNPSGKVVILSDSNGDGKMDTRDVFLDSLVLPRAICLIEDGILVAESPNLWFYTIQDDLPVKKSLVDPAYAVGGNVEHQPNSLFRALDNWIYSGEGNKRYRKKGNTWLIERTHMRGQWGMTQDDLGRLYYNNNSQNLLGDYFNPGFGATNKNQRGLAGYNEKIVPDLRVFPVRPTPGVNRGYMEGILDDSLRLVHFTAACGPVIYSGNTFGDTYHGNAFVAEPAANLIKRNILHRKGYVTTGEIAYEKKEFLASEDERFRPVNLYNGPDGNMYIIDMYRGIIQHKTYLTPYLKGEIARRNLTKPLSCGRIYKVSPLEGAAAAVKFPENITTMVNLLSHPNGWVRNKAQHLLIDSKDTTVASGLRTMLRQAKDPLTAIHALWTLEGLQALNSADVLPLLKTADWTVRMQALSVLPSIINRSNYRKVATELQAMIAAGDTLAAPYIAFLVHSFQPLDKAVAKDMVYALMRKYACDPYVSDAIISNLEGMEKEYRNISLELNPDTGLVLNKRFAKVLTDIARVKESADLKKLQERFPDGFALFKSVCQTCHGADGGGIESVAPPLRNSEWVTGDKKKLISIVLYGLTGPVTVDKKVYEAPEISGEMPGIAANKEYADKDIAQVLSFIRNAWGNKADKIDAKEVEAVRAEHKGRQKPFTVKELDTMK